MTENTNKSDDVKNRDTGENDETGPPEARIRRTPWRGWIWAVPLAAAILAGYLAVRTWVLAGPTVTVTFPHAAGIRSTGSPVRYKGVQVGKVSSLRLSDDLKHVSVTLQLNGRMSKYLHTGAKFWVVQPTVLSGDFSDLLSGSYIEMKPGPTTGKRVNQFTGLLHPPATSPDRPGKTMMLTADHAGKLHAGSPVFYRGIDAGEVLGVSYDGKKKAVQVKLFIRSPFDQQLSSHSRFWRAGGVTLSTAGGQFGLNLPSIKSLLKGAVAFENVSEANQNAQEDHTLYADRAAASSVLTGTAKTFKLAVPGSVAGLTQGSPVRYQGILVGKVREVSLVYDKQANQLRTPVRIALYPSRFGMSSSDKPSHFVHALAMLVKQGLRARVDTSNLILNEQQISLVMLPKAKKASLNEQASLPEIPAVSGSGLSSMLASVRSVADQINAIPFEQIGQNVSSATSQIKALAQSPAVKQSISHLNKAFANAAELTSEAKGQVKPTLESARQAIVRLQSAAKAAEDTARTIKKVTGGSLSGSPNVTKLVGELTQAARSVRGIADYLQRHPEALLQGRATK